jgi:hypothetical protein
MPAAELHRDRGEGNNSLHSVLSRQREQLGRRSPHSTWADADSFDPVEELDQGLRFGSVRADDANALRKGSLRRGA